MNFRVSKAVFVSLALLTGSALAQTAVTSTPAIPAGGQVNSPTGNQNNVGGDHSQVGAALNNQTYASNSNNGSGNTTVNGGSVGAGGSIINQANAPTSTTVKNITTPNVMAPNLTSSGLDTCLGSVSGGVSMLGFGASAGSTHQDENCVMIKQVKLLGELGLKDAAVARLMQEPKMREALLIAYPALARFSPIPGDRSKLINE